MILDIQKIADDMQKILSQFDYTAEKIVMVAVGEDIPSLKYIQYKAKLLDTLNIEYEILNLPTDTTQEELQNELDKLSYDKKVTGIILELPLPRHLDTFKALEHIKSEKDIDGITGENISKLYNNKKGILPCTVNAISKILEYAQIDLEGKNVAIVGRSIIVGKPLFLYLTNKNCTCTLCHSKTRNLSRITSKADILIVSIGKKHFITQEYIKDGAFVIDVGTNYVDNKIYGDVDTEKVQYKCDITPVPKGVGLLTKLCMVENIINLKRERGKTLNQ